MFRTIVRTPRTPLASPLAERTSGDRSRDTRERLLDAAEALFADRGFEGASLRAVTQAAGASVSAANYHFGSKRALLHATLLRRIEPVNRQRQAALDALEARAGALSLEAVLEAFLRPSLCAARDDGQTRFRQVAARLYSDPPELVAELKHELFTPIRERFVDALARALPGAADRDLELAFQLTVGVMVHVTAGHLDGMPASARPASDEALLRRLVAFVAAGVRAAAGPEAS